MFKQKLHPEYMQLYNMFKDIEYDRVITYEQMNEQMPGNEDVRTKHYFALYKFINLMLKEQNKALENIPTIGYKVVKPNQHIRLSNKRLEKSTKQAKRAVELLAYCDVSQLSDSEKMEVMTHQNRKMLVYGLLLGEKRKIKKDEPAPRLPETPRFGK